MKFHPKEHRPVGKQARYYIGIVLSQAHEPLSSQEIAIEVKRKFHADLSSESVGANLGYMRAAGEAAFVKVTMGMRRYARDVYPVIMRHWFDPKTIETKVARTWSHQKRIANDQKYLSTLPLVHPKRRRKPRTDDMRQMIEDFAR